MADRLPFGEGASINRPPLFCGLNYQFWKVRMKIFVESLDKGIWDAIENGPFVPKFEKDGSSIEKPWSQWTDSESKKAKFDCIAKNIITSALNSDEFFKVSQCKSAKEMWDTLEVTHEGTCTVPYPGVDKVKVKVNVGVKVNIRRRLGEETPSASIAEAGRRREEASPW